MGGLGPLCLWNESEASVRRWLIGPYTLLLGANILV
jgi:hypothetical protein